MQIFQKYDQLITVTLPCVITMERIQKVLSTHDIRVADTQMMMVGIVFLKL